MLSKREAALSPYQTEENKKAFKSWMADQESNNRQVVPVVIPVHIIVVHGTNESIGQGNNIDLERINSQLQVLNDDFGRTNDDASNTPSSFSAVDTDISFCLATIDPNGNSTTGITRYPTNGDFILNEDDIVDETIWPPTRYLNMYLAPDLGTLLGYSSRPNPGTLPNTNNDVVRVLTGSFGGEGYATYSPYNRGRTATHEIGHWLGLRHIWGNGCNGDDGFDDTPDQSQENYGCPTHPSPSCNNGGDMFMNYMDYVDDACMNSFTADQAAYMQMILSGTRTILTTSAVTACAPTGAPIVSLVNKTDIDCPGDISGSIELTSTSGTPPYTYSLDGGAAQSTGVFTNIAGGDHSIVITESEGISSDYNFTINEPSPFEFTIDVLSDACSGSTNGSAMISTSGGNETFNTVSVYNSNFNVTQSFYLIENFADGIPSDWTADTNWNWGNSDNLSSAYFPFAFNEHFIAFNDDDLGEDVINNASVTSPMINMGNATEFVLGFDVFFTDGDYEGYDETAKVFISEDNGASWNEVTNLPGSEEWVRYSIQITNFNSSTLMIRFEYDDGGWWNYGLGIDNVVVLPTDLGQFDNLAAGTYTVLAVDEKNCEFYSSFDIISTDPITITRVDSVDPSCDALGSITVNAASANGIQEYVLNGISNTTGFFNVSGAGTYTVEIYDNEGCVKETTLDLVDTGGISLSVSDWNGVTCSGAQDGSFTVDISGNQGTSVITLNGNQSSTSVFDNLQGGLYEVSVSDDNGCSAALQFNIPQPDALFLMIDFSHQTCAEAGSITPGITGGTPPYTFSLNNGPFSATNLFDNLPIGTYEVSGRDANGCTESVSITIMDEVQTDGIIEALVDCSTGINPTYQIELCTSSGLAANWIVYDNQGAQIGVPANGACTIFDMGPFISSGTDDYFYAVEATTVDGCIIELNTVAYQPKVLDSNFTDFFSLCPDEAFDWTVSNMADFAFVEVIDQNNNAVPIDNSNGFGLYPGNTYTMTATDIFGCTSELQTTIGVHDVPEVFVFVFSDATASNGGSVGLQGSGGTGMGTYTFILNGEANQSGVFANLPADEYTATIEDEQGCNNTVTFTIQMQSATDDLLLSSKIELYPNPVNTELFLSLEGDEIINEFWIYSVDGRKIKHETLSTQQTKIKVSDLEGGLYLIAIKSGDKLGHRRFIKI